METNQEVEEWSKAGIVARVKIVPDHQLENLRELSDDSLRLFRISLVVLSIYGSVFGFLFNSGSQAILNVLKHPAVVASLLSFLMALGGFMTAYHFSRRYCTNGIKVTDYLELIDEFPDSSPKELERDKLVYEHYWKGSINYNTAVKQIQYIIYVGGFSLYVAVIYAPMGLLSFYINFPSWFISIVVGGPIAILGIFIKLVDIFGKSGGVILKPNEKTEQES